LACHKCQFIQYLNMLNSGIIYSFFVQNYLGFPTAIGNSSWYGKFLPPTYLLSCPRNPYLFLSAGHTHWTFTQHSISWVPSSTCLPHLNHNDMNFRCHFRHNHLLMLCLWPFCHNCIQNILPNWTLWSW
jgi:hypothetical protein